MTFTGPGGAGTAAVPGARLEISAKAAGENGENTSTPRLGPTGNSSPMQGPPQVADDVNESEGVQRLNRQQAGLVDRLLDVLAGASGGVLDADGLDREAGDDVRDEVRSPGIGPGVGDADSVQLIGRTRQ